MKIGIAVSTFKAKFSPIPFPDGNLSKNLKIIKKLGYDGVDLFVHNLSTSEVDRIKHNIDTLKLIIPIIGPLWMAENNMCLTAPDRTSRVQAIRFFKKQIKIAGEFGANIVIGYIRGNKNDDESSKSFYTRLSESIKEVEELSVLLGVKILIEPINRYEINSLNRIDQTVGFIDQYGFSNLGLLIDTYHMNIEEESIEGAISIAKNRIYHVHISDSKRLIPGDGHLDFIKIMKSIIAYNYSGFVSIEIVPAPSSIECASKGIEYLKQTLVAVDNQTKQ